MIINTNSRLMCTVNKVVVCFCKSWQPGPLLSIEMQHSSTLREEYWQKAREVIVNVPALKKSHKLRPQSMMRSGCGGTFCNENKAPLRTELSWWLTWSWRLNRSRIWFLCCVPAAGHSLLTLPSPNFVMCVLSLLQPSKAERHHFISLPPQSTGRASMELWLDLVHCCQGFWKYIEGCCMIFGCTGI